MSKPIKQAGKHYKIAPKDVKLDMCGAVAGPFGKYEVELCAGKLVSFFKFKNDGWCSFTFTELRDWYQQNHWNWNEMLYGLMGAWMDNAGFYDLIEGPHYIVHCGDCLTVTEEFVDRCARAK